MAYDVKFLAGTSTEFGNITPKDNVLYFLTDTHEIYKGSVLYATGKTADKIKDAIEALDATVGSTTVDPGKHVAVQVVETDGKLTGLTVTEDDIASAQDLSDLTTRVSTAESNITTIKGDGEGSIKKAVKDLADGAVAKNTAAIATLNGTGKGSVAAAVKVETDRAVAAEQANAKAIADEKTRAEGAEKNITDRLDIIEGTGDGSIKKAAADAVAKVVANAPEDFDTLQEVAAWIANDTTGAAKMQADIATLMGDDTKDGSVAKALKDAKGYADGLNTAMDARVDVLEAAIGKGGSVESQIDAKIQELDAEVSNIEGTLTGDGIKVTVTQADGVITGVAAEIEVSNEITAAINALNANETATANGITVGVTQADGVVTGVSVSAPDIENCLTWGTIA